MGLSQPLRGLDAYEQLLSQWSPEVNEDLVPNAQAVSPSWMLSHWLLDRVIRAAEGGDFTAVKSLRESLERGISENASRPRIRWVTTCGRFGVSFEL